MSLGNPRIHLRRTDSTNDRARELAAAGAPHGTLVTASEQTAGHGRQGRMWEAPAGSALLASLVLRDPPPLLSLIAAVAVCDALGEDARIKWPNDVMTAGPPDGGAARGRSTQGGGARQLRKLAGILVEGRPQEGWAVLGVGVNVAVRLDDLRPDVRESAASLQWPASAIEPLLARLLLALEQRLCEPPQSVLDAWRARDALRGEEISWEEHAPASGERHGRTGRTRTGRADGVDDRGRLLVALDDGTHAALSSGEVHLRSVPGRV